MQLQIEEQGHCEQMPNVTVNIQMSGKQLEEVNSFKNLVQSCPVRDAFTNKSKQGLDGHGIRKCLFVPKYTNHIIQKHS